MQRVLISLGSVIALVIVWQLIADDYREEEKELMSEFRLMLQEKFPEQAAELAGSFGIRPYLPPLQAPGKSAGELQQVVLVHGLDDPGKVWMNLAPALSGAGYHVWIMRYPNDQPIADSSRLFFDEMLLLREKGVAEISIVAHSMGGLVSREMLTSPAIDYSASVRSGGVPAVTALIMVGTPNHGSELVRFRLMAEFRDQLVHFARGEGSWLRGILDGAGEAKIDLLPGSLFLSELNARPHPEGVDMLSIAGVATPWNEADVANLVQTLAAENPPGRAPLLDELGAALRSATRGVGDGLVTVDSTRLPGVGQRSVPGTHLSMIRNVTASSDRIPPAVPVILRWLEIHKMR